MRMKELAERARLPRTTIHYYLRENLLPPPMKSANNAARYTDEHLRRLQLIQELRSADGGTLPVAQVRRVIEHVERGVDPELAVALQRAVLGDGSLPEQDRLLSLSEFSAHVGADEGEVLQLVDAGLIIPAEADGEMSFDSADSHAASSLIRLLRDLGATVAELEPIARLIRQVSELEMAIRNRAVEELDAQDAARRSLALQQTGNFLHTYLFSRNRQRNIAALHDREDSPQ